METNSKPEAEAIIQKRLNLLLKPANKANAKKASLSKVATNPSKEDSLAAAYHAMFDVCINQQLDGQDDTSSSDDEPPAITMLSSSESEEEITDNNFAYSYENDVENENMLVPVTNLQAYDSTDFEEQGPPEYNNDPIENVFFSNFMCLYI